MKDAAEVLERLLARQGAQLDSIAGSITDRTLSLAVSAARRHVGAVLELLQARRAPEADQGRVAYYRRHPWDRP